MSPSQLPAEEKLSFHKFNMVILQEIYEFPSALKHQILRKSHRHPILRQHLHPVSSFRQDVVLVAPIKVVLKEQVDCKYPAAIIIFIAAARVYTYFYIHNQRYMM